MLDCFTLSLQSATIFAAMAPESSDEAWLARFHAGDRQVLAECYREQFGNVERALGRFLRGADRETVIHEVFLKVLSDAGVRRTFAGGSIRAWLQTMARNQAIDYLRRAKRDVPLDAEAPEVEERSSPDARDEEIDAKRQIDRFRAEVLPAAWRGVFEKRFLQQLDQREAARQLGMHRTTLAYRELRIRSLLRAFVLRGGIP